MKRYVFGNDKSYFVWLSQRYPTEAPTLALFSPNPYSKGTNDNLKTKPIDETVLRQIKIALRNEDRLSLRHEEGERQEPRIICSMGLFRKEEEPKS